MNPICQTKVERYGDLKDTNTLLESKHYTQHIQLAEGILNVEPVNHKLNTHIMEKLGIFGFRSIMKLFPYYNLLKLKLITVMVLSSGKQCNPRQSEL